MQFARRCESTQLNAELCRRIENVPVGFVVGIKAARDVFMLARKSPAMSHHIYCAAAWIEYRLNNEAKTASNIFAVGFKVMLLDAGSAATHFKLYNFLRNISRFHLLLSST